MIKNSRIKKGLFTVYIIFSLITAGFVGLMIFEGVVDEGGVEGTSVLYVGGSGPGNYSSIQAAINAASPGDTIRVYAGTYYENVVVNKIVSLIGNGLANTTIDGGWTGDVIRVTANWVNLTGFTVLHSGNNSNINVMDSGIELDNVENITIREINCSDNNVGIFSKNTNHVKIENGTIFSNKYRGIYLDESKNNTIANNTLSKNEYGIYLDKSDSNIVMNNNHQDINYSILLIDSNSNVIKNNIISSDQRISIFLISSNFNTINNNTIEKKFGHGVIIDRCISNTFSDNTLNSCGFYLEGSFLNELNTHTFDLTNTVNNKLVYYLKNITNFEIPPGAGQVILANCSKVTVENQNLSNGATSINVQNSDNITILNNTCNLNSLWGIYIRKSDYITLKNNSANFNEEVGIYLVESDYSIIENNNCISNEDSGMAFGGCKFNRISNNSCSKNKLNNLIIFYSESNFINNNFFTLSGTGLNGQYLISNSISNNTCSDNDFGILLSDSGQNTLYNNSCSNNSDGIRISNSESNYIIKNNCDFNYNGIYASYSNSVSAENNSCSNNYGSGIYLFGDNNNASNNTCNSNNYGIVISNGGWGLSFSLIFNNTCNFNDRYGIDISGPGVQANITKNTCNGNSWSGIYLQNAENTRIIDNYFNENWDAINAWRADSITIENNILKNNFNGIYLHDSTAVTISKNAFNSCNVYIDSEELEFWDTHTIDASNTVNGKPIYYKKHLNSGTVPMGAGQVILVNCTNMLIQNQNLSCGTLGLVLFQSENNIIKDNICDKNNYYGIYLVNSDSNDILMNNCSSNKINGIKIYSSSSNTIIENNCVSNEGFGIKLEYAYSNIIENNTCILNLNVGMYIQGSHENIIQNNICNSNLGGGIHFSTSYENKVHNNTCNYNDDSGIALSNSENGLFDSNTCNYNNFSGIYSFRSNNMIIKENICSSNNMNGIYLEGYYSEITTDYSSTYNLIENNICIWNNGSGIRIIESSFSTLNMNNCSNNKNGIMINYSIDNEIFDNIISSNSNYGLAINFSLMKNNIYHNNFLNNAIQALDLGDNDWTKNKEGNYWSDYSGVDNGANGRLVGDGIGDTNLPHLGLDDYPYLEPYSWIFFDVPELSDPGEISLNGNYTLHWNDDHNLGAEGYILEESIDANFESSTIIFQGMGPQYTISNKDEGHYYYRLRVYVKNYYSSWSNIVDISVNLPPSVPDNFKVNAWPDGNGLNLTWNLTENDVLNFEIFVKAVGDWILLANISYPNNSYNHEGLVNGIEYFYKLRAWDALNRSSEFCTIVNCVPQDIMAPDIPVGFVVKNKTYNSVNLTWHATKAKDLEGYNIYRSLAPNTTDWGEPLNGNTLILKTYYSDTGLTEGTTYYYVITSIDEIPNESPHSKILEVRIYLFVEYPRPPTVNITTPNLFINEDSEYSQINLYFWFKDINGDILNFRCEGQLHINVTIDQDSGKVVLKPEPNWSGHETLTFYASDRVFNVSGKVIVTVLPLNDAPEQIEILTPENGITIKQGTSLDFSATCIDTDIIYGDILTFTWSSDISGELGVGEYQKNIKLPIGKHKITLEVSDIEGLTTNASVNVTVTEIEEENEENLSLLFGLGVSVITLIMLIVFLVLYKKQKKRSVADGAKTQTKPKSSLKPGKRKRVRAVKDEHLTPEEIQDSLEYPEFAGDDDMDEE